MERKLHIDEALSYLKGSYKLFSIIKNEKYLFSYRDNKVLISTDKTSYRLNIIDFKKLFLDSVFFIYDDNQIEVDVTKDSEYYSWRQ